MTRQERSWVLYDVGNSALILLATSIIPVYFHSLTDNGSIIVAWSYAETIAALLIALSMPILGSIADMQHMKKRFLAGCVIIGIVATIALGFCTMPLGFLTIYVVSSVALSSSLVFYDAMLVDTTTNERMDEVSSAGYAWGYIGSCVPFVISLVVVLNRDTLGLPLQNAMQFAFGLTALWWAVFSIPVFKNVEQVHYKPRSSMNPFKVAKGLKLTFAEMWKNRAIRYFIAAYFFYIDGVHTVIRLSTSYGTELGISSSQLILALLFAQIVAFPSALLYGRFARRFGTKSILLTSIFAYFLIILFAALFLKSALEFWMLAFAVGVFQGGIQALSRSAFGKLCPKAHSNEYFGVFDIFGKYAAVIGTFLVGSFTAITGNASIGVFSLSILFVIGFILMLKTPLDASGDVSGDVSASANN